jgi:hypothetical protein
MYQSLALTFMILERLYWFKLPASPPGGAAGNGWHQAYAGYYIRMAPNLLFHTLSSLIATHLLVVTGGSGEKISLLPVSTFTKNSVYSRHIFLFKGLKIMEMKNNVNGPLPVGSFHSKPRRHGSGRAET